LLDRQDFYNWSIDNPIFLEMFEIYKSSEFNRKLAPTVDRIDSSKGYSLDNMRWLTHSENSRLGSISGKNKKK
jgi:hypothetical protein